MTRIKRHFCLLFIAFSFTCNAQQSFLNKEWVGDDLEYLSFSDYHASLEVFGIFPEYKPFLILGDTLRLYDKFTTSRDNYSRTHYTYYNLLMNQSDTDHLNLTALDSNALQLINYKKTIRLKSRTLVERSMINFQSISFRTTTCFGECPDMTLTFDSTKALRFRGGLYAVKKGFYRATIPDSLYQQFLQILSLSEPDKLKTWPQIVSDAPETTLEIHYNDHMKFLRTFFMPRISHELCIFLIRLPEKLELVPDLQGKEIEFSVKQ